MNESFHVRSTIPQDQKLKGERVARSLECKILQKFKAESNKWFTQYDFDGMALDTSIRRALCNLKKSLQITACSPDEKPVGRYGVSVTKYKLSKPLPNEQLDAFYVRTY